MAGRAVRSCCGGTHSWLELLCSGMTRAVCVWAIGLLCPWVVKFSLFKWWFCTLAGELNMWNNELGFFLFSSPSSCLIGGVYSAGATCTSRPWEPLSVSLSMTLQRYCFILTWNSWLKDNTLQFTPPLSSMKEKCIFGVQIGRNLTKNIKKMLLFRKSSALFGLCSEKVWLYLKKVVTLWASVKW